ncbi:MAG: flavin reductase family protein [Candidatus Izemoplasmatales bacterium]|jgi:flavin reductase (DIM6/NTAB) family NADH-FMN oxidoreductase RutF|nr:flavin reductase family protein [Candidatus Izemoplasmatales bacterium]MDD4595931.1 flavin reductase family protein [Candidatus Izemoplasmatales bacterium]
MPLEAFNAGCNIIGLNKHGRNYGMCCAWAQMIDYDKITMLIGAQSVTGKILTKGDIVGVSALALGQEAIALCLGSTHSDENDKFTSINFHLDESAILIDGAKVIMKCRVIDIMHLSGIETDYFVLLQVIHFQQSPSLVFLSAYNLPEMSAK